MPQDDNTTSVDVGGRPTKYKKEYDTQVYKLCLLGATDAEIADFFGCSESTINLWKLKHKGFSESIKSGKVIADSDVAASLHKRAKGYIFTEVTQELDYVRDDFGKIVKDEDERPLMQMQVTKKVVKDVAPDTGASMAWLKNRRPNDWRDKKELDVSGKVIMFEDVDLDE